MLLKLQVILIICLSALLLFIVPTFADPMTPTVTRVYITQNGSPITSNVDFSMKCYGNLRHTASTDAISLSEHKLSKILNYSGSDDYQYSYSATCGPGQCDIYEPYDTWMLIISHCDLSGTYQGQSFTITNFSNDPKPSSCLAVDRLYENLRGKGEILGYSALPESAHVQCWDQY